MKKTRVLHVAPGFNYGGIEKRLVDWYSFMDRDRIQFDVVKVTPNVPNPLVDRILELGGEVYSIPPLGLKTAGAHMRCIKRIMTSNAYSVVHAHSLTYGRYPLKVARELGCEKRILHSRTTKHNPGESMLLVKKLIADDAPRFATHFFACSQEAGISAFKGQHEFVVINNGIFLEQYAFDEEKRTRKRQELGINNDYVLGFVGRFSSQKNIPMLFEIFGKLHGKDPHFKLLIVGDTKDDIDIAQEADRIASEYQCVNDVIYAGRQDDITEWLDTMDALLMPSLFEGFGTVAIEAQANGLPCLLSEFMPRSTAVSENVQYLPLDTDAWLLAVQGLRNGVRTSGNLKRIADAGYDVRTTAQWLQDFYLGDEK